MQCSTHEIFSSWRSYNILFKILRHTSSDNTVGWELERRSLLGQFRCVEKGLWWDVLTTFTHGYYTTLLTLT